MNSEEKAAILPLVARLYRYRDERDIDVLADFLGLFPLEPGEEAGEQPEVPLTAEEEPRAAEPEQPAGTPQGVRIAEDQMKELLERIAETVRTEFKNTTPAPENGGAGAAPFPESEPSVVPGEAAPKAEPEIPFASGPGAGVPLPEGRERIMRLTEGMDAAKLEVIAGLIEGGSRLNQIVRLVELEAGESVEGSEDRKRFCEVQNLLVAVMKERRKSGGQVDKFNARYGRNGGAK